MTVCGKGGLVVVNYCDAGFSELVSAGLETLGGLSVGEDIARLAELVVNSD